MGGDVLLASAIMFLATTFVLKQFAARKWYKLREKERELQPVVQEYLLKTSALIKELENTKDKEKRREITEEIDKLKEKNKAKYEELINIQKQIKAIDYDNSYTL